MDFWLIDATEALEFEFSLYFTLFKVKVDWLSLLVDKFFSVGEDWLLLFDLLALKLLRN